TASPPHSRPVALPSCSSWRRPHLADNSLKSLIVTGVFRAPLTINFAPSIRELLRSKGIAFSLPDMQDIWHLLVKEVLLVALHQEMHSPGSHRRRTVPNIRLRLDEAIVGNREPHCVPNPQSHSFANDRAPPLSVLEAQLRITLAKFL